VVRRSTDYEVKWEIQSEKGGQKMSAGKTIRVSVAVVLITIFIAVTLFMLAPFVYYPGAPQYAVGWVTLALINAGLAQAKNRSGRDWFLLSLILGPFGTFILVIEPVRKK
jgi:hypothetical protein